MKVKILLAGVSIVCILAAVLFTLRGGKWDKYYRNKMDQPPRELIVEALSQFTITGDAIDLGCGVGNEAAFLIKHGWRVWAIDDQSKAIQLIQERNDISEKEKLMAICAAFDEGLNWDLLPQVDFIYASYSLPFSKPTHFKKLWEHIKEKTRPGGLFAGHFFGPHYQGFNSNEMQNMTFLTRAEVLDLFQDFDMVHFKEVEQEGQSGTGRQVHSHVFEIIARKK